MFACLVQYFVNFLVILVALSFVVVVYFKWSYSYWRRKGLFQLEPVFPTGNSDNPFKRKVTYGEVYSAWYQEIKSKGQRHAGAYLFSTPVYMPVDLELIKHVLSNDFQHFVDRGFISNEKYDPLSAHLFALGGNKWRNLRAKLTPTFTSGKMRIMFQTLVDCAEQMKVSIDKQMNQDDKVTMEMKNTMLTYTLQVIGSCAFGLDFKTIEDEDSPFTACSKKITTGTLLQVLRAFGLYLFPNLCRNLGVLVLDPDASSFIFNTVKDTVDYRESTGHTRKDFLQLLIDLRNSTNLTITEIAANALLFFIAGFETSSTAMTFCLYELATNQEIQKKTRKEILEVLQKHDGKLSYDSVKDMTYLSQVFDESLRLYPPIPMLYRVCTKNYRIPNTDVIIQKGTKITVSVTGLHTDPDLFPDPLKFEPDRFSESNKSNIKAYSYIPFGEGPRNCIGLRFGIMQAKVGLANLLRNFEFSLNPKTIVPIKMDPKAFFLSPVGGIWLDVKKIGD